MEKTIITFSANEQCLQKTSGIYCYASNIVSYIEAHFDLGANWSGYDSVRAVWSNDNNMTVISTVLDSNGVCVVPFEVLKTKGVVKVNLVGSISVSDVLTDRLTTFPCEAVKVTAKAKIEGSETQPITPSQFEQFVAAVISEVEKVTGMTAQAETLPAGSQATARYENGILYLGIPQGIQGERGETGADGNGIASVVYNADYTLTLVFDNGERFTTPPIRGERGPAGADGRDGTDGADGVTPNISIGNVETLEPSEDAYVTRRGTDANPIFDFGIPKGDKGDTGEVTMSQLSALLPTDTASGDIASFSDGTDLFPALSVKAQIEPIQDLHGYDKPWAAGAGKNKANIDGATNLFGMALSNGVLANTLTDSKNQLALYAATYKESTLVERIISVAYSPSVGRWSGRYTINNTDFDRIRIWHSGSTQNLSAYIPCSVPTTGDYMLSINFLGVSPNVVGGFSFNEVQFEAGSTATSFEPYSNICPISGRTECVTSVSGVNVWDEEWECGRYSPTTGEATTEKGVRSKNFIKVTPSTDYFLACDTIASNDFRVLFYNEHKNYISANAWAYGNTTFTTRANAHYVKFFVTGGNYGTTYNHDISINYPSTDHDYHAYNGHTYTTDLGRAVYGGTLDVVSGVLTVDRAIVDLGSLNWNTYNDKFTSALNPEPLRKAFGEINMLCSIYKTGNYGSSASQGDGTIWLSASTSNNTLYVEDSRYSDPTAFKQAMNGVQLCYELATPQTIQLTPQEVQLLLGTNNVWSDGNVTLVYSADIQKWVEKKLNANSTTSMLTMSRPMVQTETTETEETETETAETE